MAVVWLPWFVAPMLLLLLLVDVSDWLKGSLPWVVSGCCMLVRFCS